MSTVIVGLTPELESAVAAAEAAGLKPASEGYLPLELNDEIVGVVVTPRLIALLALTDQRSSEFKSRWPKQPNDPKELEIALVKYEELDLLKKELWDAIDLEFGLASEENAGLKRNDKDEVVVVRIENERKESAGSLGGLLTAVLIGIPPDALLAQLKKRCSTCDKTGCPQHPNYVPAASTEMQ